MLNILTIPAGPLNVNCYIVFNAESEKALIIDPGGDFSLINEALKGVNKQAGAVIVTHAHFDHVLAVGNFNEEKVPVYMCEEDFDFLTTHKNLAKYFGIKFKSFKVDKFLCENSMEICSMNVKIYYTPGHTPGGICLQIENALFTGDTLFKESYGRTDFPDGDEKSLIQSIKKLFSIKENLTVYPGHNEKTTLDHEKKYNPITLLF